MGGQDRDSQKDEPTWKPEKGDGSCHNRGLWSGTGVEGGRLRTRHTFRTKYRKWVTPVYYRHDEGNIVSTETKHVKN